MNKFAIPTILLATVMVAGIFAFAPVDQASTVHTQILDSTMTPFKIACAEIALTGASEDGEITLDVNGDNPIVVKKIYFKSGTGGGAVTDAGDIVTIKDIRVDDVTIGLSNADSIFDIDFDDTPTQGEIIANLDSDATYFLGDLIANAVVGVTVEGTVDTDTTTYTITFAGLQISSDDAPTCDITGVT